MESNNAGAELASARKKERDEASSSPTRAIEQRLEKLERELCESRRFCREANRRLTLVSLALGAMLVLMLALGATKPRQERGGAQVPALQKSGVQDVIRAKKLEIVDEKGNTRIALGVGADGSGLMIFDEKDKMRAVLAAYAYGPALALFDEKGMRRAELWALPDGPLLSMFDKNFKVIWQAPPTKLGLPPVPPK